ncbi:MAG: hypothetical protein LBM77_07035 [Spirochaetaceae bacterium]|jgi:hypothetical protein|nr:hypothetical protein [Spirochaetaceae bacterium]
MENWKIRILVSIISVLIAGKVFSQDIVPQWVTDKAGAYPDSQWLAVVVEGNSRKSAETAAMNALARAFNTSLSTINNANQSFSNTVTEMAGKKAIDSTQSQEFSQKLTQTSNVSGLIGVETDFWQGLDKKTWFFIARMNRRECASQYHRLMAENEKNIVSLLSDAETVSGTLDAYSRQSFALNIATANDNFQSIAHVLLPSMDKKFSYGNADAIRALLLKTAAAITIYVDKVEGDTNGRIEKAFTTFFTDRGFKTGDKNNAKYLLTASFSSEESDFGAAQTNKYINYTLDALLSDKEGSEVFSYLGEDRKGHKTLQQARQMVMRSVENSITDSEEDGFAKNFEDYLSSLL